MTTPTDSRKDALAGLDEVMGLLGMATPGEWRVGGSLIAADAGLIVSQAAAYDAAPNDLAAIVAAVNYLRSHGEAIRELVEADKEYDNARANLDFATGLGKASDAMHFRLAVAKERRAAALAKFPEPRP